MVKFELRMPTRLVFGWGLLDSVGEFARSLGNRCLVVTGQGFARQYGYMERLEKSLAAQGISFHAFESITPNPTNTQVDQVAQEIRETQAEFVIGLGGGSVMDAVKIACAVAAGGGNSWEYITGQRPIVSGMPILVVPTLAGSGSEVATGGVINNPSVRQKRWAGSFHISPRIALWDPGTTLTVPSGAMAQGALDMFSHVLERFLTGENPSSIADAWAVDLMKLIVKSSIKALEQPEDRGARETLALSSSLSITALTDLGRAGEFACHGFEHVLSGFYPEIGHGAGLAGLLPGWLRWAEKKHPERYRALCQAWGQDFNQATTAWIRSLGLSTSLKDLRVKENDIEEMNQQLWEIYPERLSDTTPEETLGIWLDCWR